MANLRENLYGRTVLYTDELEIDDSNVGKVLADAINDHETNSTDIDYLYQYYKGDQPINTREKTYNTDINNKVTVNIASEIVDFKVGYLLSAPIQYIDSANNDREEAAENSDLDVLTRYCMLEGKDTSDLEVAQWQSICGRGFRMIVPKEETIEGESPFAIYTLDPRNTEVVYSSKMGHKPMLAFNSVTLSDNTVLYYCYTATNFYVMDKDGNDMSDDITKSGPHALGMIPIIEYPANEARIGDFERVLSLMNAINTVTSNRVDGVEQFIQAILCMEGVQIERSSEQTQADAEADFMKQVKEVGGMMLPKDSKAYYLIQELNQQQTEVLVQSMYDKILTIVGMPNRNMDGASTSDTGSAVILRNGFSEAEARARLRENYYKLSERQFLNLMITLSNTLGGTNLLLTDVDVRFPRRNYTNDSANVTNLISMLSSDWITPEFAYAHSNMCADPHHEYLLAKEWHDTQEQEDVNALNNVNNDEPDVPAQRDDTSQIEA